MTGRRRVGIQEQIVEGNCPKCRAVVRQGCKGETTLRRSEEEEPWDGSDLTIVLQEVVSFR